MDYQKIVVQLNPDTQDFRDIFMASVGELGFDSFIEETDHLQAFIPANLWDESLLVADMFQPMFELIWKAELIPDQNWNEVWEKNYFKPLLIKDQCLIRAPFHNDYPKAKYEIVIEPKMAFGTGNHETTSLVIEQILEMEFDGKSVLDMGCGTGVLSILASMKGAKYIKAIDIDKWAYESTVENAEINNCPNIKGFLGDASSVGDGTFDVVFANIHKNVLIEDMPVYASAMSDGAQLFLSGFYSEDLDDIKNAADKNELQFQSYSQKNNWVVAVFSK